MPRHIDIEDFLAHKHLAIVGVSRNPSAFANVVQRAMTERGYDAIPVNPYAVELEGRKSYASVRHIPDPLDGVIVMVSAQAAMMVIDDCVFRGVTRVWLHRGAGPGAVSDGAVATCRAQQITVIDGACPMMFLDHPGPLHAIHKWVAGRRIAA